jgi:hypothetical protein
MVGVAPFIAAFRPFTTRTTVTAITVTTAAAITYHVFYAELCK